MRVLVNTSAIHYVTRVELQEFYISLPHNIYAPKQNQVNLIYDQHLFALCFCYRNLWIYR